MADVLQRYPSERALTPQQAVKDLPNLRHVIALDANWPKSAVLMAEPMFNCLPHLSLPPGKPTLFWRYAPSRSEHSKYFSPDKVPLLMSTVESVHRFCDEYNRALGKEQHSCDDLLWLFAFLHSRVRDVYQHAPGKRQRIMRKSKGLLHQF